MGNIPKCPQCGQPVSQSATYCAMCGQSLEGGKKRGCGCGCWALVLILVLVGVLLFVGFNFREVVPPEIIQEWDNLRHEIERTFGLEGQEETPPEPLTPAPLPQAVLPEAPPADLPEDPSADLPEDPLADLPETTPAEPPDLSQPLVKKAPPLGTVQSRKDLVYTTQRGYLASLDQAELMAALDLLAEDSRDVVDIMVEDEKVVWLKAGLKVRVIESQTWTEVVKVRIEGSETEFYTTREALVR